MALGARFIIRNQKVIVAFVAGVAVAGGGAYAVTSTAPKISACVDNRTKVMYLTEKTRCPAGRTLVSWNIAGPQGPAGQDGITKDNSGNLSIKDIAKKVLPTVVSISVSSTSGSETGSGSIVQSESTRSYIVTNNHVIDSAVSGGKVTVEFQDGTELSATIKGRDIAYDLAVLEIAKGNLPTIDIGDSSTVLIGDLSVAIGSPLGLSGTVTSGIISALNRPVLAGSTNQASYIDALQTDAAVNPGNSGGPLVNGQGQVIGVNSAIATLGNGPQSGSIGLGFAIPINQAQRVITEIIQSGKSSTPIAGISIDSTYDGVGAKIAEVVADGPAASTDLKVGDIVTKINGEAVEDSTELIVAIRRNNPGDTIVLTVKNTAGNEREVSVVLGSREEG